MASRDINFDSNKGNILAVFVIRLLQVALFIAAVGVVVLPIAGMTASILVAKFSVAAAFIIAIMGLERK